MLDVFRIILSTVCLPAVLSLKLNTLSKFSKNSRLHLIDYESLSMFVLKLHSLEKLIRNWKHDFFLNNVISPYSLLVRQTYNLRFDMCCLVTG